MGVVGSSAPRRRDEVAVQQESKVWAESGPEPGVQASVQGRLVAMAGSCPRLAGDLPVAMSVPTFPMDTMHIQPRSV